MSNTTNNNGVIKEFGPITVDEIKQSDYTTKSGDPVFQAQIRQEVITKYPGVRAGNSRADSLFAAEDFGTSSEYTSNRVTWTRVPEGTTVEQVEALLAKCPNARIYNVYSNKCEDVLTDEQMYAISQGQQTMSDFEEKFRIKDVNGNELERYDEEGCAQFRQSFFSKDGKEDVDLRTYKGENVNTTATVAVAVEATSEQNVF